MDLTTSYRILDLDPQTDESKAKRAYKAQVRRWHPDQFPEGSSVKAQAEEQLKQINIAYDRVKAHLALHRPDPIDSSAAPPPHSHSDMPPHHEAPHRKRPRRSWVDHLFDALNTFVGNRTDDSPASSADRANTKRKKTFGQVLDEMTGGMPPSKGRPPGTTATRHAHRRSTAGYRRYRRCGGTVGGVGGMESKGPVKPVGRVRGIGKSR